MSWYNSAVGCNFVEKDKTLPPPLGSNLLPDVTAYLNMNCNTSENKTGKDMETCVDPCRRPFRPPSRKPPSEMDPPSSRGLNLNNYDTASRIYVPKNQGLFTTSSSLSSSTSLFSTTAPLEPQTLDGTTPLQAQRKHFTQKNLLGKQDVNSGNVPGTRSLVLDEPENPTKSSFKSAYELMVSP